MILTKVIKKVVEAVQNLLVPENDKIQKLLNLSPCAMRELLPKSPVYSKDISVLFDYQNKIIRTIVKLIKYKNNANLRKRLAGFLYEEILDLSSEITLFEGSTPLLVPMPMSKNEKRKKGFNQCEELCKEIKKLGGDNIVVSFNTLKKIRETERQAILDRKQREQNVHDSMTAAPYPWGVPSRTVIVLDDVFTTGATFREARRALTSAGVHRVIGIFIAH